MALRLGLSRGLSSSEAGLGTASIAAAAARTDYPGRQALVSMSGAFLSTIIMCTITGLVIAVSGVQGMEGANGKLLDGASLTVAAFNEILPGEGYIVTVGLVFFAFSTILGWGFYGEKCMEYLFHERSIPWFRVIFSLMVIPGAAMDLLLVWRIADVTNALMAIPNLIGIAALSSVVVKEANLFEKVLADERSQDRSA
jgi:AGCS family alanine or glycine:cation symporter